MSTTEETPVGPVTSVEETVSEIMENILLEACESKEPVEISNSALEENSICSEIEQKNIECEKIEEISKPLVDVDTQNIDIDMDAEVTEKDDVSNKVESSSPMEINENESVVETLDEVDDATNLSPSIATEILASEKEPSLPSPSEVVLPVPSPPGESVIVSKDNESFSTPEVQETEDNCEETPVEKEDANLLLTQETSITVSSEATKVDDIETEEPQMPISKEDINQSEEIMDDKPCKADSNSKDAKETEPSTNLISTFTEALQTHSHEFPTSLQSSELAAEMDVQEMSESNVPLPESTESTLGFLELKESNPPSSEPVSVSEPTASPESAMDTNELSKAEFESTKSDKNNDVPSNEASLSNADHMSVMSEETSGNNAEEFRFDIKKQLAAVTDDTESNDTAQTQGEKRKAISQEEDKEEEEEEEDDTKSNSRSATPRRPRRRRRRQRDRGKYVKDKPDAALLDEETRMELPQAAQDEDSQSSTSNKREVRRFRSEIVMPETAEKFTAEKLVEYQWPLDSGDHYFVQEHVSEYLGIMSFKRKYPQLRRHPLEMQERDHLKEMGIVSEIACDLGLTAVRSEDVLDVMFTDFPDKFEELQELLRQRHEKSIKEHGKVDYLVADLDKSKIHEYSRQAAESAARWNATLNRDRKDSRRYNFDMQTFTLQMPQGRTKKLPCDHTKLGAYPVAVLPGQFTDYCKQYTMDQLRYFPLNTIIGKPKQDDQEKENTTTNGEVEIKDTKEEDSKVDIVVKGVELQGPKCKSCNYGKERNKIGIPEALVCCSACKNSCHLSCVDLDPTMVACVQGYSWKCMDCKACEQCNELNDEEKMIFCDMCDRGYHIYCVGLRRVPNGRWHCKNCAVCSNCGTKNPSGTEFIKNAEWAHEYKKDKSNKKLKYATTLCMPCDKYWKRRQFCYICLKVYRSIPEDGMVRCSTCPKYIHREVCSTVFENERYCNNCYKSRNSTALNHSRILAAAKRRMAMSY